MRQPGHLLAVLPQLLDQFGVLLVLPYHPLDPQPEQHGQRDPEQRRQQHEQHQRGGGAAPEPQHGGGDEIAGHTGHHGRPGVQAHHQHRDQREQRERTRQIHRGGEPEQSEESAGEDRVPPVPFMTQHQRPPDPRVPGHDERQRTDGDQPAGLRYGGGEHQPRGDQIADHEVAVPQPEPTHPCVGRAPRLTRHRVHPPASERPQHRGAGAIVPPRPQSYHPASASAALSTDRWTAESTGRSYPRNKLPP